MRALTSNTLTAVALAGAAAAIWSCVSLIQGPLVITDSSGYLALADALQHGHARVTDRPDRTPGYPLFLITCRAVAGLLGWNALTVTTIMQTLLVSGLGTWLVFDMSRRLGGRTTAVAAAVVYATDANLQLFGRAILTEAQATWLIVLTGWLRLRDGHWRRARWVLAALAITRPNLACLAAGFAALELARGRVRKGLSLVAPTLLALVAWLAFANGTGGQPFDASGRVEALVRFGTAYDAQLWRQLPPGDLRDTLSRSWDAKHDVYQAAGALNGQREPWQPGGDWRPIAAAATAMIRADPFGYVGARLRLIPRVSEESAFPWDALMAVPALPLTPLTGSWWAVSRLGWLHHTIFYGSFALFAVLGAATWWKGVGIRSAVVPVREVIMPAIVILLFSTAALSLSDDQIGRLGVPLHPFVNVLWALLLARAWSAVVRVRAHGDASLMV